MGRFRRDSLTEHRCCWDIDCHGLPLENNPWMQLQHAAAAVMKLLQLHLHCLVLTACTFGIKPSLHLVAGRAHEDAENATQCPLVLLPVHMPSLS